MGISEGTVEWTISLDAKKKERIGDYHRPGREWHREGGPVQAVRSRDFHAPGTRSFTSSSTPPHTNWTAVQPGWEMAPTLFCGRW
ncbi:ISAzo13-like element transposase-related protein [Streptomyces sp. 3214.6]|uniref:ISAzo13-like element transposase-related protein n=1 Tax=Streptomyces sp. 3214.6 TaxID=1882757 RepID=UPI000D1AD26E